MEEKKKPVAACVDIFVRGKTMRSVCMFVSFSSCYWLAPLENRQQQQQKSIVNDLMLFFLFLSLWFLCSLSRRLDFADISPVEYSIAAVRVRESDCIFFSLALEMLISLLDKFGLLLY